jgi:hypothetical protein
LVAIQGRRRKGTPRLCHLLVCHFNLSGIEFVLHVEKEATKKESVGQPSYLAVAKLIHLMAPTQQLQRLL